MDDNQLKKLGFEEISEPDLEKLGFSEIPSTTLDESFSQTLKDFGRGAAQGGTLGFADELTALGETGLGVVTGKTELENILDAYKKNVEESRQAYSEAAERSPIASTLGGVAGGIGLGGGLGLAAKGLQGVAGLGKAALLGKKLVLGPELASNATTGAKIAQGLAGGATSGAIAGAGFSEDLSEMPSDMLSSAGIGGLIGGGIPLLVGAGKGAVSGIKGLGKSEFAQDIKKGFELGKEGIDISTQEGIRSAEKQLEEAAPELATSLLSSQKEVGENLGKIRKILTDKNVPVPVNPTLEELNTIVTKLQSGTYEDKQVAQEIQKRLTDLTTEKIPFTVEQKLPREVKTIPFTPSSKQKLEKEIEKLKFESEQLGENAKFDIVESPDKKFISIRKTIDEAIGDREKLVQAPAETISSMVPVTKTVRSFKEISPQTRQQAQDTIATLKGKAQNKGKTYTIREDKAEGTLHIDEVSEKVSKESIPGEVSLEPVDTGFKSKAQLLKTQENLPEIPSSEIEITPEQLIKQDLTIDQVKTLEDNFANAEKVKKQLNVLAQGTELDKSPEAKGMIKNLTDRLDQKIKNIDTLDESLKTEYTDALKKTRAIYQAMGELGVDKNDLIKFVDGDNPELATPIRNKLIQTLSKFGSDDLAGAKSRALIDRVISLLEVADPAKASTLKPVLQKAADVYDLARKSAKLKFYRSSLLTSGSIRGANILGQVSKASKETVKDVVKPFSDVFNNIANATPDEIKNLTYTLAKTGKGVPYKLAKAIIDAAKKDPAGRQAAMFALQQNPEYRQTIKELTQEENNE